MAHKIMGHRLTFFQKKPTFLFHRHLVLLLPTEALPSSQTCMHVDPSHLISLTPAGRASAGQFDHNAAALIPTGCPQPEDRCLFMVKSFSFRSGKSI